MRGRRRGRELLAFVARESKTRYGRGHHAGLFMRLHRAHVEGPKSSPCTPGLPGCPQRDRRPHRTRRRLHPLPDDRQRAFDDESDDAGPNRATRELAPCLVHWSISSRSATGRRSSWSSSRATRGRRRRGARPVSLRQESRASAGRPPTATLLTACCVVGTDHAARSSLRRPPPRPLRLRRLPLTESGGHSRRPERPPSSPRRDATISPSPWAPPVEVATMARRTSPRQWPFSTYRLLTARGVPSTAEPTTAPRTMRLRSRSPAFRSARCGPRIRAQCATRAVRNVLAMRVRDRLTRVRGAPQGSGALERFSSSVPTAVLALVSASARRRASDAYRRS